MIKKLSILIAMSLTFLLSGCFYLFETQPPGKPQLPPEDTSINYNSPTDSQGDLQYHSSGNPQAVTDTMKSSGQKITCYVRGSGSWSASSSNKNTALRNAMQKCKSNSKNPDRCVFSSCTGQ